MVEALADAVATVDRPPPIHIAVDGLTDSVTRTLADDLGRALAARGRRCRRVTLDALSLLHPAGPGEEQPTHRAGPDDDLVLVDGCFLQRTGWWLDRYDDGPNRFLATAERVPGPLRSQDA